MKREQLHNVLVNYILINGAGGPGRTVRAYEFSLPIVA